MKEIVFKTAAFVLLAAAALAVSQKWLGGSDAAFLGVFTLAVFAVEMAASAVRNGSRRAVMAAVAAFGMVICGAGLLYHATCVQAKGSGQ